MSSQFIKSQQYRVARKYRSGYYFQDPPAKTKKDQVQDKKIKNLKHSVAKIQKGIEVKYDDTYINASPVSAGVLTLLNGLSLGTTDDTRVGNSIRMTSLNLRWYATSNALKINVPSHFRMILLIDRASNGAAPNLSDIIDSNSAAPNLLFGYNPDNLKRFKILYDRYFTIRPNVLSVSGDAGGALPVAVTTTTAQTLPEITGPHNLNIKLNNHVQFNSFNTGTISDINTGSLYLCLYTDYTTNAPLFIGNARMRFKDA